MLRRVLFVDDEPRVLNAFRNELEEYTAVIRPSFCESATSALERLGSSPYDAIVSDMKMPGMPGNELLHRVQSLFPRTARIALSGHPEYERWLRTNPVAHHYLLKPAQMDKVVELVMRTTRVQQIVGDAEVVRTVGGTASLPPAPQVLVRLREEFARPDPRLRVVTDIIGEDPALGAKLLHMVNAAAFGLTQRVTTVERATALLGLDAVHQLTVSVAAFDAIAKHLSVQGFNMDKIARHSAQVAELARRLVDDPSVAETTFLAGLLHEIGQIVIAVSFPSEFVEIQRRAAASNRARYALEMEVLGTTHAAIGALLLDSWDLPGEVVEAVAHHHSPRDVVGSRLNPSAAVCLATALVAEGSPRASTHIDRPLLRRYGITYERLKEWRAATKGVLA